MKASAIATQLKMQEGTQENMTLENMTQENQWENQEGPQIANDFAATKANLISCIEEVFCHAADLNTRLGALAQQFDQFAADTKSTIICRCLKSLLDDCVTDICHLMLASPAAITQNRGWPNSSLTCVCVCVLLTS